MTMVKRKSITGDRRHTIRSRKPKVEGAEDTSGVTERTRWVFEHVPAGLASVLDVGCYSGEGSAVLSRKAHKVVGIDIDVNGLLAGFSHGRAVYLARASADRLPFPDGAFDCVVLSDVLEHIPKQLERQAIRETHRTLKREGLLVLTVPHAGLFQHLDPMNLRHNMRLLARRLGLATLFAGLKETAQADSKGHKHYSLDELESLLLPLFSIETISQIGLLLYPLSLMMGFLPDGLLRLPTVSVLRKRMANWDYQRQFGSASYNVALVARANISSLPVHDDRGGAQ